MQRLYRLSFVTVVATWLLALSGGAVRVTDAAGACGGWPLCQGGLLPPREGPALVAFAHRLSALGAAALVVATAVVAVRMAGAGRAIKLPAIGALALVGAIAGVDGVTAATGLATPAPLHLGLAMAVLAAETVTVVAIAAGRRRSFSEAPAVGEGFAILAAATALAIGLVLLTGAFVTNAGASFACAGWPLCNGTLFPAGDRLTGINAFHRLASAAAGVLVLTLLWQTLRRYRHNRPIAFAAMAAVAAFAAGVAAGAGQVWPRLSDAVRVIHLGVAALAWAALVALAAIAFHSARAVAIDRAPVAAGPGLRTRVAAYVNLTKPRIIELLLVTTVPAMVLAERGWPSPWLILGTLLGGTLTAGGANAINCYIDRDIDQVMRRTHGRSLPSHRVSPERALTFGILIGVLGFLELAALINLLSAVLSVAAILFYVFVYTLWLKRTTVQNIVIGGAAGAVPPVVGWAAVTGRVDLPALVLFAIIFLWTPPHFWALALRYRGDYASAGVPMLPVARGEEETRRQIFIYSLLLVAVTLALYFVGGAGIVYLVVALLLGAALVRMAYQLLRSGDAFPVMKLFGYSITYLAALFGAMILDQAARSLI